MMLEVTLLEEAVVLAGVVLAGVVWVVELVGVNMKFGGGVRGGLAK